MTDGTGSPRYTARSRRKFAVRDFDAARLAVAPERSLAEGGHHLIYGPDIRPGSLVTWQTKMPHALRLNLTHLKRGSSECLSAHRSHFQARLRYGFGPVFAADDVTAGECASPLRSIWFGEKKLDLLHRFRSYRDGTPAHHHLGDIFATLDAQAFQRCFVGSGQRRRDHGAPGG
jgi:hypothetical protein